ncbi:digestive organ expansion factor homolog [Trichonephila clavata]|uniref:U3 small nucleolar RNA-associated protein 25 homolog n=1 Tax=Trichonephila clavata TaxID=2740835 RepID=A0A8X6HTH2_TRICU|nr:digestive organ expansion factor homolog [Trichonephila clavata]
MDNLTEENCSTPNKRPSSKNYFDEGNSSKKCKKESVLKPNVISERNGNVSDNADASDSEDLLISGDKDLHSEVDEISSEKNSDNEDSSDSEDLGDEDLHSEVDEIPSEDEGPISTVDFFAEHLKYEENLKPEELEKRESKPQLCSFPNLPNMVHVKPLSVDVKVPSITRQDISQFDLKKNLLENMLKSPKKLSSFQLEFFNIISEYYDLIYMHRTPFKGEAMRTIYTLHILNHILKSRAKIIHHNSKLSKNPEMEFRDQGFARPTAVMLVPFRHDCYQIVKQMQALLPKCTIMNKKRFITEYGPPPKRKSMKKKPQDYEETFAGNIDDDFKIGVRIQNKTVTLYSEFYSSDLIITSPLGLERIAGETKSRDFDFLSSIEILIIDRADVLYQQNFKNFMDIVKSFNHLPKDSHDCNFFRVRMYALEGYSKYFRQTVLISSVEQRWFESVLFRNFCINYKGYLSTITEVKTPGIDRIPDTVRVCFRLFDSSHPQNEIEDRFSFFTNKILPDFKIKEMMQTLIYIPSYFDFTRLRNYFRENELSSVMVCEHSKPGKVAQARNNFFQGWRHFMLYTERAHFYNRYTIKGVQHVIFYQPPTNPKFFQEVNFFFLDSNPKRKGEEKTCTIVASKFDFFPFETHSWTK